VGVEAKIMARLRGKKAVGRGEESAMADALGDQSHAGSEAEAEQEQELEQELELQAEQQLEELAREERDDKSVTGSVY
jgi:hypothetical protein